jgi:hypothetical protein
MKLAYAFVFLLISSMAGCLQDDIEPVIPEPQIEAEYDDFLSAYQFENVLPMGHGNSTEIYFDNGTEVKLVLHARFHEPVAWEQGYVNLSIVGPGLNVTIQQSNDILNYTWVVNSSGNHTIEILSEGSDNQADTLPGDAYIAEFNTTIWRVVE